MLGLLVHCGAAHVERSELGKVVLPAQTETHTPIAHDYLADLVEDRLNDAGLRVVNSEFALGRKGADMFGLMEVGSAKGDDFATVVGFRNSHVKKLSAGLVLGKGVFVCDNLCFSGEVGFGRRHTNRILDDLPDLVTNAIGKIMGMNTAQVARAEAYKEKQISNEYADHLIVNMLREGVINTQRVEKVVAEWDTPTHEEFKNTGRSVWRLEQATTEALKGSNVIAMPDRTQKLVNILDDAAEFEPVALAA
jgi:hypothetical protein